MHHCGVIPEHPKKTCTSPLLCAYWGDLHHLQRLTWLVEKGQKNGQRNNAASRHEKQCRCRLSRSSENRAFEGCRATVPANEDSAMEDSTTITGCYSQTSLKKIV